MNSTVQHKKRKPTIPEKNFFDREKVCAQLTVYSELSKYKKKFPSMKDKTITALK